MLGAYVFWFTIYLYTYKEIKYVPPNVLQLEIIFVIFMRSKQQDQGVTAFN